MKFLTSVISAVALGVLAQSAFAATACETQAGEKKLAGAAKTSFLKKCEADSKGAAAPAADSGCEAKAVSKDGKKLAGAAKTTFMKKCEADAKGEPAAPAAAADSGCEAKAVSKDGKKLAGAAKTTFMKKCEADAKAKK